MDSWCCCFRGFRRLFCARSHGSLVLQHTSTALSEDYALREALGEGSFGQVKSACCKSCGAARVVKSVPLAMAVSSEVSLQAALHHPHICRIFETFQDSQKLHIVLEECRGPSLLQITPLDEDEARVFFRQLMRAVSYMHGRHIAHRDLKLDNLVLKEEMRPGQENVLKVIDFGLATEFSPGFWMTGKCGTYDYVAPEVMIRDNYDETCDIWSAGICLCKMLSGRFPFGPESGSDSQTYVNLVLPKARHGITHCDQALWNSFSDAVQRLICTLCTADPSHRPSACSVLAAHWLVEKEKRVELTEVLRRLARPERKSFKRVALQVAVYNLEDGLLEPIRENFEQLDRTGKGLLTLDDFQLMLQNKHAHVDDARAQCSFHKMDTDEATCFTYSDFLVAGIETQLLGPQVCMAAFRCFDKDGDKLISAQDLQALCGDQLTCTEVLAMLREADSNGDGVVDYDEFVSMLLAET
eukprot:TRINITY_DN9172_c0_g1_i1.p1 TRINITY_DN9172_c0_g1~~TRINITY_DN9172_c0_g1_i1.p1  ORF type:complete len:479 (-),score=94.27 TRINITY_DN9172_c0_g1_i1:2-1408(-)